MKILFFISSLENGGAERAMSNITTHLPAGVEADVLVNSVSESDYPTSANIISLGMESSLNKNWKYQLKALCKRIPKLYFLKRHNHYDACISFMDSANVCNIITGKKYCKTIVSVRIKISQDKSWTYQYIVRPLAHLLYNKASYVVAVAEGVKKDLVENLKIEKNRIMTITNGYDIAEIRNKSLNSNNQNVLRIKNSFVFVTSGRYTFQKGQWHLIRAFSKVVSACGDNVRLVLMGQGREEDYLREVIKYNDLGDKVIVLSHQQNPFCILHQSDVFVMPSMYEGYCNALCEALICELPCIATDFQSSAREILAPDTPFDYQLQTGIEYAAYGVLTPVCSGTRYKGDEPLEEAEEYLAEAMISFYEDRELLEEYQNKALVRGKQMDINAKVQEWMNLVSDR